MAEIRQDAWTAIVDPLKRPRGVKDYEFVLLAVPRSGGVRGLTHRMGMWDPETGMWVVFGAAWDPVPTHWVKLPRLPRPPE